MNDKKIVIGISGAVALMISMICQTWHSGAFP
jgi:hypothetical protein